jgi:hypothetical protein
MKKKAKLHLKLKVIAQNRKTRLCQMKSSATMLMISSFLFSTV